jgi:hypothetical protein
MKRMGLNGGQRRGGEKGGKGYRRVDTEKEMVPLQFQRVLSIDFTIIRRKSNVTNMNSSSTDLFRHKSIIK